MSQFYIHDHAIMIIAEFSELIITPFSLEVFWVIWKATGIIKKNVYFITSTVEMWLYETTNKKLSIVSKVLWLPSGVVFSMNMPSNITKSGIQ